MNRTPAVTLARHSRLARSVACSLLAFACASSPVPAADDLLVEDFERADYGAWQADGEAFGPGPARGTLPNQMQVSGFLGNGLVNSYYRGDDTTGTLTSPPIKLQRKYVSFLIGGGGYAGETCFNLLVDGKVVRTATGPNTQPGGSERLEPQQWDVGEWQGREARLQVVDARKGGWGHINLDHIVQTDTRLPGLRADVSREIRVAKRYLNLPVKNGAPKRLVSLMVEGRLARQFEIELADGEPDWWAFLDLQPFAGKTAALKVDQLREDSRALKNIEQSDSIAGAEDLYREKLRPQFHFSARRGWNNDPNGLVYYDGEYHLFFQHNPYGWNWGNMHWGQAVSRDLVHWEELPEALYPDRLGTMFSGGGVVDHFNTAGFQTGKRPAIVLFYTAAGGTSAESKGQRFTQCLAYSNDRGRTWTKYEKNPVLPHIVGENRDPKVLWYAPEKKWVMALYLDGNEFGLFESRNLKDWKELGRVTVPGSSECPEFFEIPVESGPAAPKSARSKRAAGTRWVFYGGNGLYLVGRFDGKSFTKESGPHPLNFGNCFYASQTYSDIPEKDGRRILVPWGQLAAPGMPFNQLIGLPVELTLRPTAAGLRLFANPVREIASLRSGARKWKKLELYPGLNLFKDVQGELLDIQAEFEPGAAKEVVFRVRGMPVSYDVEKQELTCADRKAPLSIEGGKVRLRLLADRTTLDIFGNQGAVYMPMGLKAVEGIQPLQIEARGGSARVVSLEVHRLNSAWRVPKR